MQRMCENFFANHIHDVVVVIVVVVDSSCSRGGSDGGLVIDQCVLAFW